MRRAGKCIGWSCAAIATLLPGIATDRESAEPVILEPSTPWHLNYADDSCQLARKFGEGERSSALLIERYEPGDAFFLLAADRLFDSRRPAKTVFRFGPEGREFGDGSYDGNWDEFGPAVMVTGMTLLPLSAHEIREKRRPRFDPEEAAQDTDVFGQELSAEQEARIEWLEVQRG